METKTIVMEKTTLHVPREDFVPYEFDINGAKISGKYSVHEVNPGTAVTFDAVDADRILKLHAGKETEATSSAIVAYYPPARVREKRAAQNPGMSGEAIKAAVKQSVKEAIDEVEAAAAAKK